MHGCKTHDDDGLEREFVDRENAENSPVKNINLPSGLDSIAS
jgi:hypothetical protein